MLPGRQEVQEVEPGEGEKVPGEQGKQIALCGGE